jgi:DNA polymerase III subunit gamma/tau
VIGHDWRVVSIVDPSAQPGAEPRLEVTRPAVPERSFEPPPQRAAETAAEAAPRAPFDPASVANARGAIQGTRPAGGGRPVSGVADADADRDDRDADDQALGGAQLLERELGASIIEEIKHE